MKGETAMESTIVKEGTDILKRLSPKNQTYFMTLLRLAEIAEDGAKNEISKKFHTHSKQNNTKL